MTEMTLQAVRQLIANDSYAITFQSVEQYRATLLRHVDSLVDGTQQYASGGTMPADVRLVGEGLRPFSAPAAQQASAPGALDGGEMTRLRRLMRALGHGDAFVAPADYVRGILFVVLGEAASRIERAPSGPGTSAAPGLLTQALTTGIPLQEPVYIAKALRAQREARASLAGGTGPSAAAFLVNIQMTPWTFTKETAEAYAEGYNRALKDYRAALLDVAAQLDGGQGEERGNVCRPAT